MPQWEEIRHQVSIAGQVLDALTGRAVACAEVEITSGPKEFAQWLAERKKQHGDMWDNVKNRPDRMRTRHDGHFHFMDLPDGQYTLQAWMPGWGSRYAKDSCTVTVAHGPSGEIIMAQADMTLAPTCIRGQISAENTTEPIALAEVRIKDSGQRTFSSENGHYCLACIETGKRTVIASAQGFEQTSLTVLLNQPGQQGELDMVMKPATP